MKTNIYDLVEIKWIMWKSFIQCGQNEANVIFYWACIYTHSLQPTSYCLNKIVCIHLILSFSDLLMTPIIFKVIQIKISFNFDIIHTMTTVLTGGFTDIIKPVLFPNIKKKYIAAVLKK